MDKRFWAIIGVIVVVFGGVLFINNMQKEKTTVSATNHVIGNTSSKVTLLEYGDFQCPACSEFYTVTHEVAQKYEEKIAFQFRNLPLVSLHPNAFAASRAAEAADKQGKFWQMHDKLYEEQDPNGQTGWVVSSDPLNDYFTGYAKTIGLNVDQFKKDFASKAVNDVINADMDAFNKTGEQMATPSFFLNGKKVDNNDLLETNSSGQAVPSLDKFGKLLDKALTDAK